MLGLAYFMAALVIAAFIVGLCVLIDWVGTSLDN